MTKHEKLEYYLVLPPHLEGCAREQALCYDFIEEAELRGWRVIPEYPRNRFDMLLVAQEGCTTKGAKPGMQIGVQAKMQANVELLDQMLEAAEHKAWKRQGPDYIVALVPGRSRTDTERTVERALKALKLGFFYRYEHFVDHFHAATEVRHNLKDLKFCGEPRAFPKQFAMPELDYWVEPGVSGPSVISSWLISALKFCMALETKSMNYRDFDSNKMSISTWLAAKWVVEDGHEEHGRKRRLYKLNPDSPKTRPDLKHPDLMLKMKEKHARQEASPAKEG